MLVKHHVCYDEIVKLGIEISFYRCFGFSAKAKCRCLVAELET